MSLGFTGNQTERLYSAELNNMAKVSENAVLTGCEVSPLGSPSLAVQVDSGKIFFGNDSIDVSSVASISVDANGAAFDRLDLVAVNSSGVVSIIKGTAQEIAPTPDYDPTLFVILAIITIEPAETEINAGDIKDIRVLNVGGGGAGGGSFGRYVDNFVAQTNVTVTHNLGDDEPLVQAYDSSGVRIPDSSITSITVDDLNSVTVVFAGSTTGYIIVHGGSGVNNAVYINEYPSSATWTIVHNLQNKYVNVALYNGSDVKIEESDITSITATDENTTTVVFGSAKSGTAQISVGIATIKLNSLLDVDISSVANLDIIQYNSSTEKWENVNLPDPTYAGPLGEVKMLDISATGAVSKADMQTNSWAICDGTTPASQGISSPTIATTRDMRDKFVMSSDDETSGTTGGEASHNHTGNTGKVTAGIQYLNNTGGGSMLLDADGNHVHSYTTSTKTNSPPFIEMAFFIKVKV